MELKTCPECGVPVDMTGENLWLNNGEIVQKRRPEHRVIFAETEYLDPLFHGVERIIQATVEPIVITAARRAIRAYLRAFVPDSVSEKIRNREMEYRPIVDLFSDMGRTYGYGSYNIVDLRYEQDADDYCTVSISEPYSVPMTVAGHLADLEVVTGVDQGYRYEQVSTNLYNITAFPSEHPEGLKERMRVDMYQHTDGGVELERCATCGGPLALSVYQWYPDRGVIANRNSGRHMAIQGSTSVEPIFDELETELGDAVPRAVVEAQRRFTRSGFYTMDDITNAEDYRAQLALRGLGNLTELVMKKKGMRLRLDNAALPLILVGQAQGFFEIGFGVESTVDWELDGQRNLQLEVKPKG